MSKTEIMAELAHLSPNDLRVRSAAYTGHLYSVREVRRAFAALGLELHRGPRPGPGLVSLVNNARLGPQHIPSPRRVVTVFVLTGRQALQSIQFERGRNTQVTRYANITVVSKPDFLYQVRSAVSATRRPALERSGPRVYIISAGLTFTVTIISGRRPRSR